MGTATIVLDTAFEVIFIVLFAAMLIANFVTIIKFKVYQNASSTFILVLLAINDFIRLITATIIYNGNEKYTGDETLSRLSHDVPSVLFDCVTISILLQFAMTYDVLSNPKRMLKQLKQDFYKKLQIIFVSTYMLLLIFDLICLAVDQKTGYTKHTWSTFSDLLLTLLDTAVWAAYICLFIMYLVLFKKREGALDSFKK